MSSLENSPVAKTTKLEDKKSEVGRREGRGGRLLLATIVTIALLFAGFAIADYLNLWRLVSYHGGDIGSPLLLALLIWSPFWCGNKVFRTGNPRTASDQESEIRRRQKLEEIRARKPRR
jgi:hypothetical protein